MKEYKLLQFVHNLLSEMHRIFEESTMKLPLHYFLKCLLTHDNFPPNSHCNTRFFTFGLLFFV